VLLKVKSLRRRDAHQELQIRPFCRVNKTSADLPEARARLQENAVQGEQAASLGKRPINQGDEQHSRQCVMRRQFQQVVVAQKFEKQYSSGERVRAAS
jgi:hypothetical protein